MAAGWVVRDFPMISDPRLMRNDIAHAHICGKIPLVGIEPATLSLSAQTLTQITKWSGGLDFLRAGALAKFPDAIQTDECFLLFESIVKKRTPPFYGIDRKRNPGSLDSHWGRFIFRHDSAKGIFPLSESRVGENGPPPILLTQENGGPEDWFARWMF